jgi:hypothetical protein|tara:strand:+ start:1961 stop:2152 length:192 start_codon:yes stop_codon:yes gene_type:complete
MDIFLLLSLGISAGCIAGIAFLVNIIIKEERDKREKESFVRAFSKRHNKGCPHCRCLPCQCGS